MMTEHAVQIKWKWEYIPNTLPDLWADYLNVDVMNVGITSASTERGFTSHKAF